MTDYNIARQSASPAVDRDPHSRAAKSLPSLIDLIRHNNVRVFRPVLQQKFGYTYPDLGVEALEGQLQMLELLERNGLAVAEDAVLALKCPDCSSYALSFKLSCHSCKSGNLAKGSVVEHLTCGNTDFDERYIDEYGHFVCRKCNKRLNALGVDYSRPGVFYRCQSCNSLLPSAEKAFACLGCGKEFPEDSLVMLLLPVYAVKLQAMDKFARANHDIMQVLAGELREKQLKAVCPCPVLGALGVPQKFGIVIYANDNESVPLAAGDFSDQYESDETTILYVFAKSMDTGIKHKMIIASRQMDLTAEKLAAAYGIRLFRLDGGTKPETLVSSIAEWIQGIQKS